MNLMYSNRRWNHVMMEPANRAVKFVKFVCSASHLMIAIATLYQIHIVDCGTFPSSPTAQTYNTSDGRLCYKCAQGQYWVADCIKPGEVAQCQPCAEGFFQTVENVAHTCQQCTKHCTQQNQIFIEACNSTTDNICQCSSGYFKLNDEGFCKKHSTCAPGQWVKSSGNKDNDTICESCIAGKTFSVNESATGCLPCTICDVKGLDEMTPCTIKSDAQCVTSRPPDRSHDIGAIVGGTIGSLVLVTIIVLAVVWYFKRHKKKLQSPEDGSERNHFIDQSGPSSLDGNNSNTHPEEWSIKDQVVCSKDDETEHKSNEVLSNSKSNCSSSIHKGIHLSILRKLSNDLISANWKFFFRELSVEENRIQQVENDNMNNILEQIYQLFLYLNQKGILTKTSIIKALESVPVSRNDLAAKYSEEEFSDS